MMDLIRTRKQNFIRWKMNVKKLSKKSEQSMVGELKQRMDVPLEEVLYPFWFSGKESI